MRRNQNKINQIYFFLEKYFLGIQLQTRTFKESVDRNITLYVTNPMYQFP